MKVKTLLETFPAMQVLSSTKLPAATAIKVRKWLKLYKVELTAYDEVRVEKAQELGTLTEDGQGYSFEGENVILFQKEIEALQEVEVEAKDIPALVPFLELGNVEIEARHLDSLLGLVISE